VSRARGLIDAVVGAFADEHAAQVRQVELIAALCDAFSTLDAAGPVLPGHERLIPSGHDGTPQVAEHVATELAPQLRRSIEATMFLIADVMDLLHRHPHLWHAVKAGDLAVWQARRLTRLTAGAELSLTAALWVDEQLAPTLGHLPWGRIETKLQGLILRADAELAARKAAQAREQRFVRVRQQGDGTAFVIARTDAADAHRLWHTLTQMADQLALAGDTGDLGHRRATALGVLATPETALALLDGPEPEPGTKRRRPRRPKAELVIHLAPGSKIGRCEELGPVLAHQIQEWLGHHHVTVHPVIDLSDNPAVDTYEIPDKIARVVRWRNPYDVFPWSARRSHGLDLDHTVPFDHSPDAPAGQTCPDNLGPLSRRAHNAKTHAGWHLEQPEPGVFLTTSRLGYRYRTDPDGYHQLPTTIAQGEHATRDEKGERARDTGRMPDPRTLFPIRVDYLWPPPRAA